jgi:hypothetical protein
VLLLSACASHNSTNGSSGAKDQVAAATGAWVAAYNTRDPARISALYDQEAVLWARQQRQLVRPQLRSLNILKTLKSALMPGLRSASNIFECTEMLP